MRWVLALSAMAGCDLAFPVTPFDAAAPPIDAADETAVVSHDLVARYTMRVDPGGVLIDETASGHDGACLTDRCPLSTEGKHGVAGAFDGVDDSVRVVAPPQLDFTIGFTVAAWIRADDQTTGLRVFFGMSYGDVSVLNTFALLLDESIPVGRLRFDTVESDANSATITADPFPLGSWHHVVIRLDGSNTTKTIFIDGASVATSVLTNPPQYLPGPLMIGSDLDLGAPKSFVVGAIDEVQVYNVPLSDSDVFELAR